MVSWNPSLGSMQFDLILSEEGEDRGSASHANVGHEMYSQLTVVSTHCQEVILLSITLWGLESL